MKYRPIRKRRRQSLTNYTKRIALLKGGEPRVVVRKSNRGILVQLVEYKPDGDKVLTAAVSSELRKFDWVPRANMPTAYLTGLLIAKKAKKINIQNSVLDIGLSKPVPSSVVFAAAKGAADGGVKLTNSIELDAKRTSGQHIADYAKKLKQQGPDAYKKHFSDYAEKGFDAEKLPELFENTKKKIMSG